MEDGYGVLTAVTRKTVSCEICNIQGAFFSCLKDKRLADALVFTVYGLSLRSFV